MISIHALRVEGDINCGHYPLPQIPFLSTPSGWRATNLTTLHRNLGRDISIHALRVEGDIDFSDIGDAFTIISIHALRVEGDPSVRIT